MIKQPQPRSAPRWALGVSLPVPEASSRPSLAMLGPCKLAPCPAAERLYVLGGLSGLFRPERAVSVYDPGGRSWSAGPSLPAARHHLAAARLVDDLYVS